MGSIPVGDSEFLSHVREQFIVITFRESSAQYVRAFIASRESVTKTASHSLGFFFPLDSPIKGCKQRTSQKEKGGKEKT